jgi:hypothetical protein
MYLSLLETSGNQQFIFSTNKLSENIGASELTYVACSKWVVEAVTEVNGSPLNNQKIFESSSHLRDWLLNPAQNRSIQDQSVKIEIILATSGKALFLAKDCEDAREVIRKVTQKALREAPGLDICGIISENFDIATVSISTINKQIHQRFESVRANRPGPDSRFLRLPVIAECATSGMPASIQSNNTSISTVSATKRNNRDHGFDRIQRLLDRRKANWKFAPNDSDFEESPEFAWKAVIHADGNGLGQIFLDFGKGLSNNDYVQQYRQFSCAIDICTEEAFLDAIATVFADRLSKIPMRPLILGGDDLTVICSGQSALQFTAQFLINFEEYTSKKIEGFVAPEIILQQARQHLPAARLSACAGVAIVKQHFPFSVAYHLAEDLIKSAKTVKEIVKNKDDKTIPCSAIDYHILYDSSCIDLNDIRTRLEITTTPLTRLYGRPYIVSKLEWYDSNSDVFSWISQHHWKNLTERVKALHKKENERYLLPNSQMHDLREGLFLGKEGADARYKLIRTRYLRQNISILEGNKELHSLFWQESKKLRNSKPIAINVTGLLDAMDAASFWEEQK